MRSDATAPRYRLAVHLDFVQAVLRGQLAQILAFGNEFATAAHSHQLPAPL